MDDDTTELGRLLTLNAGAQLHCIDRKSMKMWLDYGGFTPAALNHLGHPLYREAHILAAQPPPRGRPRKVPQAGTRLAARRRLGTGATAEPEVPRRRSTDVELSDDTDPGRAGSPLASAPPKRRATDREPSAQVAGRRSDDA